MASFQKVHVYLDLPEGGDLEILISRIESVRDFGLLLDFKPEDLETERQLIKLNRITSYLGENEERLYNPDRPPRNDKEQLLFNIHRLYEVLESEAPQVIDLSYLKRIHRQLLSKLPEANEGGMLRRENTALFEFEGKNDKDAPPAAEIESYLKELFIMANDPAFPPLLKAFTIYYLLDNLLPFISHNELLARLVCYSILKNHNLHFFGLINLESSVFTNQSFCSCSLLFSQAEIKERFSKNLSSYLNICLRALLPGILSIEKIFHEKLKQFSNYQFMPPKQKNILNYWMVRGFKENINTLNQMSHSDKILFRKLLEEGSVSMKKSAENGNFFGEDEMPDASGLLKKGLATIGRDEKLYLTLVLKQGQIIN